MVHSTMCVVVESSIFPLNRTPVQMKMKELCAAGQMNRACACIEIAIENLSHYAPCRLGG